MGEVIGQGNRFEERFDDRSARRDEQGADEEGDAEWDIHEHVRDRRRTEERQHDPDGRQKERHSWRVPEHRGGDTRPRVKDDDRDAEPDDHRESISERIVVKDIESEWTDGDSREDENQEIRDA